MRLKYKIHLYFIYTLYTWPTSNFFSILLYSPQLSLNANPSYIDLQRSGFIDDTMLTLPQNLS